MTGIARSRLPQNDLRTQNAVSAEVVAGAAIVLGLFTSLHPGSSS